MSQPEAPDQPTFLELARQALSSTPRGYDLLAPKFEATPYATPTEWLEESFQTIRTRYPLNRASTRGLDLACGTGRGCQALAVDCDEVVGVDFSQGMLCQAQAMTCHQTGFTWWHKDLASLQLEAQSFDRIVTFGAWGHILEGFRTHLLTQILRALRPDGVFFTLSADRADPWEKRYWQTLVFDTGIKLRNRLWPQEFHMYYRLNTTEELEQECLQLGGSEFEVSLDRLECLRTEPITLLVVHRKPNG